MFKEYGTNRNCCTLKAKSAVFRWKSSGNNTNDTQQGVMSPACIVLGNNYILNPILIQ
jgi:hypothetical protein